MASHDSLPPHTHGSVPCRWLAVTRAGLSSLPILALLGALMLLSFYFIYEAIVITGLQKPYILLFRDIKQREEQILDLNTQLEDKVRERTTQLESSDEALRRSEENFRHSLDDSLFGVRIVTEEAETLYANRSILDIYGYDSIDELRTTPAMKRYTPESFAEFQTRKEKRKRGENGPHEYEISIVRKDGAVRDLRVFRTAVRWDGKRQFQVTYHDITNHKQAEEALKVSELEYRNQANFLDTVTENSPFAMWVSDAEGTMIRANQSLRNILNVTDDMIIGKYNVLHDENLDAQGLVPIVEAVFNDLKSARFTMFWTGTKAGDVDLSIANELWIDVSLFPITDEVGKLANVVCQYVDITERKQAEEQLNKSLREKETLLREVHHRVKNNMQVMSGLLDLQAKSNGNPELINMLHASQDRIRSMALVHERLYASNNFARIDLAGYARALSQDLFQSYSIDSGKIDLIIQADDGQVDINKAIPCGLILNELISNALKHAFPGDGPGEIKIIIHETENVEIEIAVCDNGLGLPDDIDIHQPRSVGLYLVNGLVKNQLDGQINVTRDAGTEIRIKFPV